MHKFSSTLKILGLTGLGLTAFFFTLEAFVPGMDGVHWLGMITFMPGLAIYLLGVFVTKPKLDANGNMTQTTPLGKAGQIVLTAVLLLFALPILYFLLLPIFDLTIK